MKMTTKDQTQKLYRFAFCLSLFTIFYNIAEGIISTYLGYEDESLALFGFGIDSFIEVVSGLGIAHMILRIQKKSNSERDNFERQSLQITGLCFYLLVIGILSSSLFNIYTQHKPITTFWGMVISTLSIVIMWALKTGKSNIGKSLNSHAIIADANCTKVCLYISILLLLSSTIYHLTRFPYIDSIGALGIAYFAFNEGRECFEKIKKSHRSCE